LAVELVERNCAADQALFSHRVYDAYGGFPRQNDRFPDYLEGIRDKDGRWTIVLHYQHEVRAHEFEQRGRRAVVRRRPMPRPGDGMPFILMLRDTGSRRGAQQ